MTLQLHETSQPHTNPAEQLSSRGAKKLGGGAYALAEKAALNRERRMNTMAKALPRFVSAQHLLEQSRSRHPSLEKVDVRELKETVIGFNSILHDISDHDASIQVRDIRDKVMRSPAVSTDMVSPMLAWNYVKAAVQGMRNEAAFEGVTCYIDGVEDIRSGTVDDDLMGIDKFVSYKGVDIAVDVKASPTAALKAIKNHIKHEDYDSVPIWSGFTDEDFGGGLRVTDPDRMSSPAEYIEEIFDTVHTQGYASTLHKLEADYADMIENSVR